MWKLLGFFPWANFPLPCHAAAPRSFCVSNSRMVASAPLECPCKEGIQVDVLRHLWTKNVNFEANNLEPQFEKQAEPCLKDLDKNVGNSKGQQRIQAEYFTTILLPLYDVQIHAFAQHYFELSGPINTASSFAPSLRFDARNNKIGEIPATAIESHWLVGWYQ